MPGFAANEGGSLSHFEFFGQAKRRVPVIAQVTIELFGTMLNGTEINAALTALEPFPIDVIGMNCGTGPKHMTESIRYLCENAPKFVSVLPNAGLPQVKDGAQHYDETPESFTAQITHFAKDFGVNIVGGCCGTTPAHLKAVVEAMRDVTPKQRDAKLIPSASSIYFQQPYVQDTSFLIVGERVNASGSKRCAIFLTRKIGTASLRSPVSRSAKARTYSMSTWISSGAMANRICTPSPRVSQRASRFR
jgi:5-methyltetrahydrofolate--homocysteine methyltransferase